MDVAVPILVAFITAVLGPVAMTWARTFFSSKKKESPVGEAIKFNQKVDEQLCSILESIGADRIWIAQFHNGGHFYPTGKSIQKFSIFYEAITPGTISVKETFQNIPASIFPRPLAEVYRNGYLQIVDYKTDDTYSLEAYAQQYKTKSLYMFGIYNLDEELIGLMTIAYTKRKHQMDTEETWYVKEKAAGIGAVLHNYLKANARR
jgi:hypothetical protein